MAAAAMPDPPIYVEQIRTPISAPPDLLKVLEGGGKLVFSDTQVVRPESKLSSPQAMRIFSGLGLLIAVVCGVLLAFSAFGINLIHPFLSLLGLVGGLGWLVTAWVDLFVWRRDKLRGNQTTYEEKITVA
jgi:hypothetical protein